ncbi:MAG: metallophosphoesterase [Candidatus Dojkabacteria bacterium]
MQYSKRFTEKIIEEMEPFHYSRRRELFARFVGLSIDYAPIYLAIVLLVLTILGVDSTALLVMSIISLAYSLFHFYKIFVDSHNVVLRQYEIKIPGLKKETSFMFVSDMHYGPEYYGAERNKISRIIDLVNSRNKDLVIFGGDFVCSSFEPSIVSEYAKVKAKNVIGVYGNHDSLYLKEKQKEEFPTEFFKCMEGSGIKFLNNEGFKYEDIYFGGITDLYSMNIDIEKAFVEDKGNETRILISHHPDIADFIKDEDSIQLILSGHTHAGQVRLPIIGPVLPIPCRNKSLVGGLYKINEKLQLFISEGAGFSSTRLRIGTVCEVCEITLIPE